MNEIPPVGSQVDRQPCFSWACDMRHQAATYAGCIENASGRIRGQRSRRSLSHDEKAYYESASKEALWTPSIVLSLVRMRIILAVDDPCK